ncbi:GNAT family N-acetyltransferase [Chloroflexota bacterium]
MNSREWDGLIGHQDGSKIYHLYEWGILLNEVHGHRLVYLVENGGVFPLALVKSRVFGNRLISLPFADYGGPCAKDRKTAEALVLKAEEIALELDVDFMETRCPDKDYSGIFEKEGFVRRDDYLTYLLSLDKELDELWRGIGDKNRNMVRKAERNNVEIKVAANKDDLREFYTLYLKTMKKLGSPPQPFKFFERMWSLFYPENLLMPMAMHNGKCIASGIFFLHNGIIHHAYSCSLREGLKLAPNDLIQWQVIKLGHEQGFKQLDFGRTRGDAGNVLFKRRWGAEVVKMPYYYKFYNTELKQRPEIKYRNLSTLWSRYMPAFIANRIGPWLIKQIG